MNISINKKNLESKAISQLFQMDSGTYEATLLDMQDVPNKQDLILITMAINGAKTVAFVKITEKNWGLTIGAILKQLNLDTGIAGLDQLAALKAPKIKVTVKDVAICDPITGAPKAVKNIDWTGKEVN